jgi:glycosyltransferase involved in cell wall biosynthesis
MRILHVIHDYCPAVGGSEVLFQRIAEGLSVRGHDVHVFTSTALRASDFVRSDAAGLQAGAEVINGVAVRRFPYRRLPPFARAAFNAVAVPWWKGRWPAYGHVKVSWIGPHLPGFVREAIALRPDIVVAAASPFRTIYLADEVARRTGAPVAIMPCLHPGDAWVLDNPALFSLLRRVDAVLTLTDYERLLLQSLGVAPECLYLLGGGVDENAMDRASPDLRQLFGIEPSRPIVLFMGRKEEGKGVRTVVDAMVECWENGVQVSLVVAGVATEYSRTVLDRYVRTLPSEWQAHIVCRDDISEEEKWGWYRTCSLLAHPSRIESFGLVYLEAWACGKAVIGGRTGPQASLITNNEDGLLVRFGDRHELASAIQRLIDNPELSRSLGANGLRKARERYSWPKIIERAAGIYEEIVDRYRVASSGQRDRR